jgi:dynein heavy chain
MKELEDSILHRLASATGDITEDIELIEGLENTKKISVDIGRKSEKALQTQQEIKVTSEKYRPVADRSALLFFLMNDLVKMHTYYIYSLAAFLRVFYRGINKCMAKVEGVEYVEQDEKESDEAPKEVNEHDMHANDLTDEQLEERCKLLLDSITETVYFYLERGLFVKDKLTVACLLTLKILVNDGLLESTNVDFLVQGKIAADPGNMGTLSEWLPDAVWARVKGLQGYAKFKNLGDNMQSDADDWQIWFDLPKPEEGKLPGDYQKICTTYDRLVLLRALRPDRVTAALYEWIGNLMGKQYVDQPVFDMKQCYSESSPQTPTFFVLFAGTDPTPWVEGLARELDITTENGRFCNISMGQGQEKPAESCVSKYAVEGGWVMLQNCHLMHESGWVPKLERLLEKVSEHAHPEFRCFISAEPPAVFNFKNMPESLMQSCIKVANEAPADIKSNMMRSWSRFSQEMINACGKPQELKGCLFALSWFHSIVLGRRRFGQQGWSRKYSFNTGDLEICAAVNKSYLDAVQDQPGPESVPWDDLRYLFGEIFYGGHITDAWDRRTANTYLEVLFSIRVFDGVELGPGFKNPKPEKLDYKGYEGYVEEQMPPEAPPLFGLHPNAEIGYLTNTAIATFKAIQDMSGGAGGGGGHADEVARVVMDDLMAKLPENFVMVILHDRAKSLLQDLIKAPFVVVALQEAERMNDLLGEMRRSLIELDRGLKGQLNMSDTMEDLVHALSIDQWPGRDPFSRCIWQKLAWHSQKTLFWQFTDLLKRVTMLSKWVESLERPVCMWISGMFNPTAYLTSILQATGRNTGWALDKMAIETHVTMFVDPTVPTEQPHNGVLVHGIFMEGARWPTGDDVDDNGGTYDVEGTKCGGALSDGRLKELLPLMPVVYAKAVQVQSTWEATGVGYLRHVPDVYECPCYFTTFRGPTYVFLATLRTMHEENPKSKWILTGTAMILQTNDA